MFWGEFGVKMEGRREGGMGNTDLVPCSFGGMGAGTTRFLESTKKRTRMRSGRRTNLCSTTRREMKNGINSSSNSRRTRLA